MSDNFKFKENLKTVEFYFLVLFIVAQPFINNLNGLMIRVGAPSIIGPAFYFVSFIIFSFWGLRYNWFRMFFIVSGGYFFLMVCTGYSKLGDFGAFSKVILPISLFSFVYKIPILKKQTKILFRAIRLLLLFYCLFALLSLLLNIPYGEGHYIGLVWDGNDYMIMLFLAAFYFRTLTIKDIKLEVFVLFAILIAKSKTILAFIPLYLYSISNIAKKYLVLIFVFGGIAITIFIYPFVVFIYESYFSSAESVFSIIDNYGWDYTLNVISFGRTRFFNQFFDVDVKSVFELVFGSGVERVLIYTNGKGGIEMDIFDSYNYYGFFGLSILMFFYYIPVYKLNIPKKSKILFLAVVIYSAFGGHFYNNPMSGSFYAIVLGLMRNKNLIVYNYFKKGSV